MDKRVASNDVGVGGADRQHRQAFPTTQWTEVARAADGNPAVRREALGKLIERYRPAFRAHLMRRRGLSSEQADDLFQGFVCDQVVAGELITKVDRERGRLRNYLLSAVDHYLLTTWRYARAQKRSSGKSDISLDGLDGGDGAAGGAAVAGTAVDVFDLAWARQVLSEAVSRMQKECQCGPQPTYDRIWKLFERRVLRPIIDGVEPPDYAEIVRSIGFASPTQASNALVTGKRMMARLLRAVIAEYAADPSQVEAEMRDLWEIASSAKRAGGVTLLCGDDAASTTDTGRG